MVPFIQMRILLHLEIAKQNKPKTNLEDECDSRAHTSFHGIIIRIRIIPCLVGEGMSNGIITKGRISHGALGERRKQALSAGMRRKKQ